MKEQQITALQDYIGVVSDAVEQIAGAIEDVLDKVYFALDACKDPAPTGPVKDAPVETKETIEEMIQYVLNKARVGSWHKNKMRLIALSDAGIKSIFTYYQSQQATKRPDSKKPDTPSNRFYER